MNSKLFKFCIGAAFAGAVYLTYVRRAQADDQANIPQRTFHSIEEATNALVKVAKAHDRQAMHEIFGPDVTNFITGDSVLDEKHFDSFATDLSERCDAVQERNGKVMLDIGREPWSFPVPLIKTNGIWLFDTIAGEEEIVNRHIGRDEYYAIGVCRAYLKAQNEYAERFSNGGAPKYAMRFRSTPGKMDGLYWPSDASRSRSPLASFVAEAAIEGYNWNSPAGPRPFHGYFFKVLTRQGPDAVGGKKNYIKHGEMRGGFALVAYPIRWGVSGVMAFVVNQDGVIYQRSLGEETTKIASAMKSYNPDKAWTVVKEAGMTYLGADAQALNAR